MRRAKKLHEWNVSCKKACAIQNELAELIVLKDSFTEIRTIAGCDLALDLKTNTAYGGVIVYTWPDLRELERQYAVATLRFPYVPGLLSFREIPVLLKAITKLKADPDMIILDGQGTAHPRALGLASHIGLWLDKPTIGCAKSRLFGEHEDPPPGEGASCPLYFPEKKQTIGMVLRTRAEVKPIYVSPGHKICCETALKMIRGCCDGFRIPKPTREADHYVESVKRLLIKNHSKAAISK